jgi:hypothetical protein
LVIKGNELDSEKRHAGDAGWGNQSEDAAAEVDPAGIQAASEYLVQQEDIHLEAIADSQLIDVCQFMAVAANGIGNHGPIPQRVSKSMPTS